MDAYSVMMAAIQIAAWLLFEALPITILMIVFFYSLKILRVGIDKWKSTRGNRGG